MSLQIDAAPQTIAVEKKASGSSFYAAMRIMPKTEREAMYAIYGFCRAVDDIADDGRGSRAERAEQLDVWRDDIETLYAGGAGGNAAFLGPHVQRYGMRKADFLTVIDGMAMDVAEDIRAPDLALLDLYCERVASAVGRLSIKVFGMDEEPGDRLAHHLGRALQLTNIVRDLDEDASIGRLYLPHEILLEAGIADRDPVCAIANPAIDAVARKVAKLAHEHYAEARAILRRKPKGQLRAPKLMGAVYAQILAKMEAQGWVPPRSRASIGKGELLLILLRHGLM
ncbi:MAG: presqualene diphosphate synthase HpnD [Rhizomicrobium sp.]|jgi:phytoene synthase